MNSTITRNQHGTEISYHSVNGLEFEIRVVRLANGDGYIAVMKAVDGPEWTKTRWHKWHCPEAARETALAYLDRTFGEG